MVIYFEAGPRRRLSESRRRNFWTFTTGLFCEGKTTSCHRVKAIKKFNYSLTLIAVHRIVSVRKRHTKIKNCKTVPWNQVSPVNESCRGLTVVRDLGWSLLPNSHFKTKVVNTAMELSFDLIRFDAIIT